MVSSFKGKNFAAAFDRPARLPAAVESRRSCGPRSLIKAQHHDRDPLRTLAKVHQMNVNQ
jgi:hypothetical protein